MIVHAMQEGGIPAVAARSTLTTHAAIAAGAARSANPLVNARLDQHEQTRIMRSQYHVCPMAACDNKRKRQRKRGRATKKERERERNKDMHGHMRK
jgi:hypothetical protein